MKVFLLGALTMYLLSCVVAIILDETRIVDIWDFSEWYFQLPILPFALVFEVIKKLCGSWWLLKYGLNPFGKMSQLDNLSTEQLKEVYKKCKDNSNGKLYIGRILKKRGEVKDA